jgi:predicted metalloprotease with PDZ domain
VLQGRASRCSAALLLLLGAVPLQAQPREPIVYTLRVHDAESHLLDVEATVPTEGRPSVELRMARWSPGFYRVEDYAAKIQELRARDDGAPLEVERVRGNRWRVATNGASSVVVAYRLLCDQRSVTTNWVSSELGVLNGAATFLTLVETGPRPHEVRLERPATWKRAMTALGAAPGGRADHYRARDYEVLVDSPILAGDLDVHEFEVAGSRHVLVDAGPRGAWDGRRAAADLERFVRAVRAFWGFLPFERYLFLNVFRQAAAWNTRTRRCSPRTPSASRRPKATSAGWRSSATNTSTPSMSSGFGQSSWGRSTTRASRARRACGCRRA